MNSKIIQSRFKEMQREHLHELNLNKNYSNNKNQIDKRNEETVQIINSITYSGQIMWFYNQNQIQRMKIDKNEFRVKLSDSKTVEMSIEKVIQPFMPTIYSREISVFYAWKNPLDKSTIMQADWQKY